MAFLYEVTDQGLVNRLSAFSCGIAPTGGHLVCAENALDAQRKFFAWRSGRIRKQTLHGFRFPESISPVRYPIRDVIF